MKPEEYILEDLFAHRNKAYGVYALRKAYNKYITYSFVISCVVICTLFIIPVLIKTYSKSSEGKLTVKDVRSVEYAALASPPPIEASTPKVTPPAVKPKMKSTVKFVKPVAKPDEEVEEEELVPTQEELKETDAALQTVEGDDDGVLFFGDEMDVVEEEAEEKPEPLYVVQIMPSFPGGQQELLQYLSEEIIYPRIARDNDIQGLVVVQFIIEPDGSISDIQILRSLHPLCDEEVIRVVQNMPPWNPGIQNEHKVRVRLNLPVNFTIR